MLEKCIQFFSHASENHYKEFGELLFCLLSSFLPDLIFENYRLITFPLTIVKYMAHLQTINNLDTMIYRLIIEQTVLPPCVYCCLKQHQIFQTAFSVGRL